jgi:hypothetical protein
LLGYFTITGLVGWLLAQHHVVFPAHDDWGLAVLDYVVQHPDGKGRTYGIGALLEFIQGLYMKWTGRVGAMFAVCATFRLGVEVVRIVQCSVILAIAVLSTRICVCATADQTTRWAQVALAVPTVVLLCMPERVAVDGLYWFTAAAVYAWAVPLLLASAVVAERRARPSFAEAALLGACAMFSEPLGAAAIAFAGFRILLQLPRPLIHKEMLRAFAYIAIPFTVFALCIMAPGNFLRHSTTQYPSTSIISLFTINVQAAARVLAAYQSPFFIVWTAGLFCQIVAVPRTKRMGLMLAAWIGVVLLLLASQRSLLEPWLTLVALLSVHGGLLAAQSLEDRSRTVPAGIFAAAVASLVFVLAVSPYVASRSLLAFVLIMVTPISWGFIEALKSPGLPRTGALLALSACLFLGFHSSKRTYEACAQNYQTQVDNDVRLRKAAIDYRLDPSIPLTVDFYQLPNPDFAEKMPYERPIIERWIKKYYELPQSTQFAYPRANGS